MTCCQTASAGCRHLIDVIKIVANEKHETLTLSSEQLAPGFVTYNSSAIKKETPN